MDKKSLNTLKSIQNAIVDPQTGQHVDAIMINNPAQEVEKSLVSFVTHRLSTLRKNIEYEESIRDVILSRIGEASFPQLISLLEVLQAGNVAAARTMMAPFIAQDGGKTLPESLRNSGKEDTTTATQVYEATENKQVFQAMLALSQLVDGVKATVVADPPPDHLKSSD